MRDFSLIDVGILLGAAQWTIILSLVAFAGGGLVGMLVTLLRISPVAPLRLTAQAYILVFQGTPLLMQMFLAFFGLGLVGIDVSPLLAVSVALTLYSSAFLAEIWRGTIEAVPRPQWEGSESLGMNKLEQLTYVILPQAFKMALPPTVGFAVQIVKSTSLAAIIGFTDLTRAAQLINTATLQPLLVFCVAALIYFLICYPLSALSRYLERRLHAGRASLTGL